MMDVDDCGDRSRTKERTVNLAKVYKAERQLVQARIASRSMVESIFRSSMANDLMAHVKHYAEDTIPSWSALNESISHHDLSSGSVDEAYADGGLDSEDEKLLLHLKQHYREHSSDEW